MTTNWLDEPQRQAWVRLAAVVELLPAALDAQLRRDADLTHFEYWVLSMLSEAPERTLRMTALAQRTNSTLSRLSHVAARLQTRGLVTRRICPDDRRATDVTLTPAGWDKVVASAPGHLQTVRHFVIDALDASQIAELTEISTAILARLDPDGATTSHYANPS